MRKKVIITEQQLKTLVTRINENEQVKGIIKTITNDLIMNYEPAVATFHNGLEYENKSIITKKVDGDKMSGAALLDYFTNKYTHVSDEFIEQVIRDWYEGVLDGNNLQLSKNVKYK
jgi:hypothetical protein